jgi:zinc transport system ATP-binding protein
MNDSQALIAANNLEKSFGRVQVLSNVSLKLLPRNIMTIIGPNGSGKTTLVRILLGLDTPVQGTITRKDRLRIGYVPQKLAIDPTLPLTTSWFLALTAKQADDVVEVAREVGVEGILNQPLQALSGGELQRVLIARALLSKPELLVLDEPAQGVDVTGQAMLYALIARLKDTHNLSVLMVSHDLHLVMSATDHVICLNHHICCSGHPHSVRGDPAFAALFGQHVADSLAVYTHHHDHDHNHPHHHA